MPRAAIAYAEATIAPERLSDSTRYSQRQLGQMGMRRCPTCERVFRRDTTHFVQLANGQWGQCLVRTEIGGAQCASLQTRTPRSRRAAREALQEVSAPEVTTPEATATTLDANVGRAMAAMADVLSDARALTERLQSGPVQSTGRKFGVEMEFVATTREDVRDAINNNTVYEAEMYGWQRHNERTYSNWTLTTDSSVHNNPGDDYNMSGELVSPILQGQEGMMELRQVIKAASEHAHMDTNATCGLHVHFDMNDEKNGYLQDVFGAYIRNEDIFYRFVAPSRSSSQWCRKYSEAQYTLNTIHNLIDTRDRDADIDTYGLSRLGGDGRYRGLNVAALSAHMTLEFRLHQGSANALKVCAWIELLQAFMTAVKVRGVLFRTHEDAGSFLDELVQHGGLSPVTAEYMLGRSQRLSTRV